MQNTYGAAIETLEQVGKVVDSLYAKVRRLSSLFGQCLREFSRLYRLSNLLRAHCTAGHRTSDRDHTCQPPPLSY